MLPEKRNRVNKPRGGNGSFRLFVGNLTLRIEEKDLLALFESIGQINSIRVMTDEGVSRGFAFVEMTSEQEMVKAITKLNGKELDGHLLRVRAD
jgi:RNA recognition motif-containing protein